MREAVKILLEVQLSLTLLGCATRSPAPTPVAVTNVASAQPVGTVSEGSASASPSTNKANPDIDQTLVKRGYEPRKISGQQKYCKTQTVTGSHFSNTVCLTAEQIRAVDDKNRSDLDQLGRAGRAACRNNNCD